MQQLIPRTGTSDSKTVENCGPNQAHFTQGLKAIVQLKSSNSYWCKSWNQPQGIYTWRQCSFTGEFSPNFNPKNMILTYTKDFS
jgi:hypothetical protein